MQLWGHRRQASGLGSDDLPASPSVSPNLVWIGCSCPDFRTGAATPFPSLGYSVTDADTSGGVFSRKQHLQVSVSPAIER